MTRCLRLAFALAFVLGAADAARCQGWGMGRAAAAPQAPPEPVVAPASTEQALVDSDALGNPRGALYQYLMNARRAQWKDAARALDLSGVPADERETQGSVLARQLKVVLDRTIWFDLDRISDRPTGTVTEGLPDDVERIGTITTASGPVDLTMRRVADPDSLGRFVWKFSPVLVDRLPALYDEFRYGWIGDHVPPALQTMGPLGLEKWQLLGITALVVLAWIGSWLVTRVLTRIASPLARRTPTRIDDRLLVILPRPVRLTLAFAIIAASLPAFAISRQAAVWVHRGVVGFGFVIFMFYVAAVAEAFAQRAREKFAREGQSSGAGVVDTALRLIRVLLVLIAVTGLLHVYGFNVTTIVAGLGIGGIAVALAAQKTIENLFGGLTLMADKPVRIGDYCRFGTQEGWVEDIGLRSTRVRTPARTVISVPNSTFSSVEIENLTARDRMRFSTTLNLRYETTPDQMRSVLEKLRALLTSHPDVGSELLRVRFSAFGPSSLDVQISAYILTPDVDRFLQLREDLLLRIMEVVSQAGTGFAYPSQTLYMARDRGVGGTRPGA